jgi:hypothetical protein
MSASCWDAFLFCVSGGIWEAASKEFTWCRFSVEHRTQRNVQRRASYDVTRNPNVNAHFYKLR